MDLTHNGARKSLNVTQLPGEVFEIVFSHHGLTRGIIRLWTSGSPAMRHHIRRCATVMVFECQLERVFARVPLLLAELTSLRSLTISRGQWYRITDIPGVVKLLNRLGSTLEKLILHFKSHNIYEPDSGDSCSADDGDCCSSGSCSTGCSSSSCSKGPNTANADYSTSPVGPPEDGHINFAKHFPRLLWLEIGTQGSQFRSIRLLPPTLTRLKAYFNPNMEVDAFPPSLTYLEASSPSRLPKSFWAALPAGLECLDLSNYGSSTEMAIEDLFALPRSLKRLVMTTYAWTPTAEHLKALPPNLDSLENVSNISCQFLEGLPTRLKKRLLMGGTFGNSLALSPSQIRSIPRSMTALQCRLKEMSDLTPSDLPTSLTYLRLTWSESFDQIGMILPSTLCTLEIRCPTVSTTLFAQLPKNLTHLSVSASKVEGSEFSSFPPLLQHLSLRVSGKNLPVVTIGKLPETLRYADLFLHIDVQSLFSLPPLLRTLHIAGLSNWSFFDPADPKTIERIEFLREEARKDGVVANELAPTFRPREYGVFDLLPRTLNNLQFGPSVELEKLAATVWQSLPKNLSNFQSARSTDPMPADVLDYLYYENIAPDLCLPQTTWRDDHIKRLSPHLNLFETPRATWNITSASAPWMPYCASLNLGWTNEVQEAYNELLVKRNACLKAHDREAFHALDPRY